MLNVLHLSNIGTIVKDLFNGLALELIFGDVKFCVLSIKRLDKDVEIIESVSLSNPHLYPPNIRSAFLFPSPYTFL